MPDLTTVVIALGAWMALALVACALCAAAGRADRARRLFGVEDERPPDVAGPPYVVDTGGLRAQLRAASGEIEADHLAVIVDVGGSDAVVAASRPLTAAEPGDWRAIRTPVRRNGREVAVLQALRRPGTPEFEPADRRALDALAGRLGDAVLAAEHDATSRPPRFGRVTA
jgi:hypothetical protein